MLDLSLTGVSVRTEHRPPVGEHILIGHRAGRVARHHTDGMGIEFLGLSFAPGSETDTPQSADLTPPSRPIAAKPASAKAAPAGSAGREAFRELVLPFIKPNATYNREETARLAAIAYAETFGEVGRASCRERVWIPV